MTLLRTLLTSILLVALFSGVISAQTENEDGPNLPENTLNKKEIVALFSGKSVESVLDKNGRVSLTYYNPDGQLRQQQGKLKRSGRWKVHKNGRICLQFEGGKDRCRIVVKEGSVYRKYIVKLDGHHERIITYTAFHDGNLVDP